MDIDFFYGGDMVTFFIRAKVKENLASPALGFIVKNVNQSL